MPSTTISTRLEADEFALLETLGDISGTDRSSLVRSLLRRGMKELRLEQAVKAYRQESVTLSRASKIAGLSQWEFIARMCDEFLELHYGVDEFASDLNVLSELP